MAFSSLSIAFRRGIWAEKPRLLSTLHTWVVLYFTPNSFLMTSATRFNVHSSVGYPYRTAPFLSIRLRVERWLPVSFFGLPLRFLSRCFASFASSCFVHLFAVTHETSSANATAALVKP